MAAEKSFMSSVLISDRDNSIKMLSKDPLKHLYLKALETRRKNSAYFHLTHVLNTQYYSVSTSVYSNLLPSPPSCTVSGNARPAPPAACRRAALGLCKILSTRPGGRASRWRARTAPRYHTPNGQFSYQTTRVFRHLNISKK